MKTIKQIVVIGCLLVVGIVFGYNLWMEYCLDDSNPNNYATIGDIPAPEGYIRVKQYLSLRSLPCVPLEFDNLILEYYASNGFKELGSDNLKTFINIRFNSMRDAKERLNMSVGDIRAHYFELQRRLYSA